MEDKMDSLKKAEELINKSTMFTVSELGTADWVMALTDDEGYPTASMITASRADGFKWIAFCTLLDSNKYKRTRKDPRTCVYLFDKESFSGVSLTGKVEIRTDLQTKKHIWYDALGDYSKNPEDDNWCVLMFIPERYNIFIDGRSVTGTF